MSTQKRTFVIDTNVILHDPRCIYKFAEHDVVIPIQVIEELDTFKKGYENINFSAREFCRIIDEISGENIFNGGVPLGEGMGNLRIMLNVPLDEKIKENFKAHNVDAEIINIGLTLQKKSEGNEVVIVSKDVNLRLKAKSLSVKAEDFLSETVTNINSLFEEVRTIEINDEKVIDRLYSEKNTAYNIPDITENQNVIIKAGTKTALAVKKKGALRLVAKEGKHSYVFNISPKNTEQAFAIDALLDRDISLVAVEAKAGTGKTILSLACGLHQMQNHTYKKLFFSRQTISMGDREIGFLKGGVDEKIGPFMMGMHDNLDVLSNINEKNKEYIAGIKEANLLLIEPLAFIRGRSLNEVYFIIDEAQNLTPHEVKTITSRAGMGTKIIFIGDTHQIDHPYLDQKSNGLSHLIDRFRGQECFSHIHLVKNERSPLAELAGKLL